MARYCVVCGAPIRTGIKYCYMHRNTRDPLLNPSSSPVVTRIEKDRNFLKIGMIVVFIPLVMAFIPNMKLSERLLMIGLAMLFLAGLNKEYKRILGKQADGTYNANERLVYRKENNIWGGSWRSLSRNNVSANRPGGNAQTKQEEIYPSAVLLPVSTTLIRILLWILQLILFFVIYIIEIALAIVLAIYCPLKTIFLALSKIRNRETKVFTYGKFEKMIVGIMKKLHRIFKLYGEKYYQWLKVESKKTLEKGERSFSIIKTITGE